MAYIKGCQMKKQLFVILLSMNLLFLGCSAKNTNVDAPSASTQEPAHSVPERILIGGLAVGMGAIILTTAAVVILLLVPKAQMRR